jgi:hypothetical protein
MTKHKSFPSLRAAPAALAAAIPLLLLIQMARAPSTTGVSWNQPTRVDGFRFDVSEGSRVTVTLRASTSLPDASVHIVPVRELPQGAEVNGSAGEVARATLRWIPGQAGDYAIRFRAATDSVPRLTSDVQDPCERRRIRQRRGSGAGESCCSRDRRSARRSARAI